MVCVVVRGSWMYRNYFSLHLRSPGLAAKYLPIPAEPSCWLSHSFFSSTCYPILFCFLFAMVRQNPGLCAFIPDKCSTTELLMDQVLTHMSCFFSHSASPSQHSIHKNTFLDHFNQKSALNTLCSCILTQYNRQ